MVVAAVVLFLVGLVLVREGTKPVGETGRAPPETRCRPPMSATSTGSG